MPIYEYQCQQCRLRLEKLQKMSDAPLVTCPECGQETLKKLVSAAAFRLKGSGWYETDFKKDGKKNLAGDDAGKAASSGDTSTPSDGKTGVGTSTDAGSSAKTAPKTDTTTAKTASTSSNGSGG